MEPMMLSPEGKGYLWGGSRLKTEYNKKIDITPLAETWECSIHPDGPSHIISGIFAGDTLDKVLEAHPEFVGTKRAGKELPILIKFIDANKDLSIQVHPDDEYAWKHENQNGKTEMWYVMDAAPGAKLICGFAHDVSAEELRIAVEKGDLAKYLQKVEVHKGDTFFITPGTVHAIGAGILIAEIQENSNVTYRVYDYGRTDNNGQKRELHFEKAVSVLNMQASDVVRPNQRIIRYYPGCSRELLSRCEYFETEKIQMSREFSFSVLETSFQVLLCLEGSGMITRDADDKYSAYLKKGDCLFIPAGNDRFHVNGEATLLKTRC